MPCWPSSASTLKASQIGCWRFGTRPISSMRRLCNVLEKEARRAERSARLGGDRLRAYDAASRRDRDAGSIARATHRDRAQPRGGCPVELDLRELRGDRPRGSGRGQSRRLRIRVAPEKRERLARLAGTARPRTPAASGGIGSATFLRRLGLVPQLVHLLERRVLGLAAILGEHRLDAAKPPHEFRVGAAQRSFRIDA